MQDGQPAVGRDGLHRPEDRRLTVGVGKTTVEPVEQRLADLRLGEVDNGRDAPKRGGARSGRERIGGELCVWREGRVVQVDVTVDCTGDDVVTARVELDLTAQPV